MKKIYFLIVAIMELCVCSAQKINLSLNLEKGKTYTLSMNTNSNIIQTVEGQTNNIAMSLNGKMAYLVKQANDSFYEMDVSYESLSMEMDLPQGKIEFNSEKEDQNDVFSMILAGMKGKPFKVKMSKKGKIEEVRNIESIFDVFDKFSQLSQAQKTQFKNQLMQTYGEKAFKGSIEMITAIYPDTPVLKGDKWNVKTQLESGMPATILSTYELKEKNDSTYRIYGDSNIETPDTVDYVEINGMPIKYIVKGKMFSDLTVDNKSGWILEATINQEMEGDAYFKETPELPEGLKIPMILKHKMVIRGK